MATIFTAAALLIPVSSWAVDVPVTPATFSGAYSAAGARTVLLLASGDYGSFQGSAKPGTVVIKAAPGATATMRVKFNGAANLELDGLTFGEIEMTGSTHNIVIRNSTVKGQTTLRTGYLQNANILFDHNVHPAWDKCDGCGEGRVWLPQKTSQPSGITIENSRFGPGGDSDGIQNGSNGTRILNNEFVGIKQVDNGRAHADSIQLYGSSNTVISGNYFHDDSVHIMAPDGGDHEIVTDNVFVAVPQYRPAIQFGAHEGTQFVHNTVRGVDVHMDSKNNNDPSSDGILRDNVMMSSSFNFSNGGGCVHCAVDHNLMGGAVFVGGANPASYAGFELAPGSPGKGAATDGTDQGARIHQLASAPGAQPPAGASKRPVIKLLSSRKALRRKGLVKLRVRMSTPGLVALAVRVRPQHHGKARPGQMKPRVLRFRKAGSKVVKMRTSRRARLRVRRWGKPQLVIRSFSDRRRNVRSGRFVLKVR